MTSYLRAVTIATIFVALAPGEPVHAQQERTPQEVADLLTQAERGDPEAQLEVGEMYVAGRDVPQNDVVAFAWYRQAAEQGVAAAQFNVGLMYSAGRGVPQDEAEAVTWYQKAAAQGLTEAVDEVIARAAAYVEDFVEQLSTVVMEEDYRQTFYRRPEQRGGIQTRLVSEFLLMRVQGIGEWIGFRDVFEVNGRQIRDRQDRLATLFLGDATTALAQAQRIAQESARYNLGSTGRTFNVPTYALFFLHPSNTRRFRFEKAGEGCADENTAWDIRFEEIEYPTLTRGFEGISLPSHGRFCLDPMSGRVIETQLELYHPSTGLGRPATDAMATVRFALEPRLNLWVPLEMRERYSERIGGSTSSTARYRNYRQFSVSVSEDSAQERIVPPGTEPPAKPDRPE